MFKSRVIRWVFLLSLAAVVQAEDRSKWITLGTYEVHPTRLLAKWKNGVALNLSAEATQQLGSKVNRRYKLTPGLAIFGEADPAALAALAGQDEAARRTRLLTRMEALRQSGLFEFVEPDYIVHVNKTPSDQSFVNGTLWGLRNMGQNGGKAGADISATNAWDITTGSTNVIVAVIDTGIRYTHLDLASQMWRNPGGAGDAEDGFVNDVFGINAITGSGDPFDDNDHGTHVAGTIGAAANDGHPHVGVCWQVRLMACKFLDASGAGATSDAITCIDYAVGKNVKILNNSWGGGPFSQALFDSINRARQEGVLFVAAAGNNGTDNDVIPFYPASYQLDNIIAVAALNRNDLLANFSQYGRTTVHVGAPGVEIFSCTATSDTSYGVFDGTSQAAPHVSGVAALILAQFPGAELDEVRQRILLSTVPIPALKGRTTTGGRVNAYKALTLTAGTGILQISIDPPSGSVLLTNSLQPIFVKVKDFFGVTNATVTATVMGVTNLTFANDGQPPDVLAGDSIYSALFRVPASLGELTMTVTVTAPGKIGATNVVTYTIVAQPSNDNFANATKVPSEGTPTPILTNNKFATLEPGEPLHGEVATVAASLWWAWTPKNNTNVFIDTTGSSIDSVLAVYTGSVVSNLQVVASASKAAQKKQAYLSFDARSNTTYRIVVASADTNSLGSIHLRITPGGKLDSSSPFVFITSPPSGLPVMNQFVTVAGTAFDPTPNASGVSEVLVNVKGGIARPAFGTTNWSAIVLVQPGQNVIEVKAVDAAGNFSSTATREVTYLLTGPINDLFANAIVLTGTSGTSPLSNTNATKEVGEPNHAGSSGGKSLWWKFTPPQDGVLFLSTTNSTFDTVLGLYLGDRVNGLTAVTSNDDAFEGSGYSELITAVQQGRTYHIAVDGFDGVSGTGSLTYTYTPGTVFSVTVNSTVGGSVTPSSGFYPSNATVQLTAVAQPNYEFSDWQGSVASAQNPLLVTVVSNVTLTAHFRAHVFSDDFETGNLTKLHWTAAGNVPWLVQAAEVDPDLGGRFAARSGVIGDNQVSSLMVSNTMPIAAGSFLYRVSSEPTWDKLQFFINGVKQQEWSGDIPWSRYQFSASGPNTLEWRYVKDASTSVGLDAAFIDNVDLPVAPPIINRSPALLSARLEGQSFRLHLIGQPNQQYIIQGSTNLMNWQPLATNAAINGVIEFTETIGLPARFYRALAP